MITFCFDFGNTRLKLAVFKSDVFLEEIVLEGDGVDHIKTLLEKYQPSKSILSSVVHHNNDIEQLLSAKTQFHLLSALSLRPFTVSVGKADTIGADRLALMAAAVNQFPNQNTLVISLGTCITYNFVNQQHQFLGGAISPGMEMRFKSMHDYTAKLPMVAEDWNFPLIGYDTKTNLQSGVIVGIASEIEGFIEKYSAKYGNFNVVLTGGHCTYFASQLKYRIFADVNFLFKGLYALSELNNQPI
jgi:type III pantothenate kinase